MPSSTSRATFFTASLLILLLTTLLQTQNRVTAQTCPPSPDGTGNCSSRVVSTPNSFPFATTMIGSELMVVVADFLEGSFYKYSVADIGLTPPTTHAAPLGAVQITGVAWHPVLNDLFWIMETGAADRFVRSELDGTLISNTAVVGSSANFAGLTWNPGTNSFWTLDFENDLYVELDESGTVTGNSFSLPFTHPFGGLAYGLGLHAIQDSLGVWFFDVPWGSPADLRTAQVERVSAAGESVGFGYALGSSNDATGWITGISSAPVGSTGGPVHFLVDFTEGNLIEVPIDNSPGLTVSELECSVSISNNATLSWQNNEVYNLIEIERDGVTVATLGGFESSFIDFNVPDGTLEYRVIPAVSAPLPARTCTAVAGRGAAIRSRPFDGEGAFGVTVIESLNRIVVTELLGGSAHFYQKDLVPDGTVLASPFTGGDATSGIAWNSVDDTLLWHSGDTGALQFTDLAGMPLGLGFSLDPLPIGLTGDISYSAQSGTYYGVNTDTGEVFEFNELGVVLATCAAPPVDGGLGAESRGVAVALGATGEVLDLAVGPAGLGRVDRVVRLDSCVPDGTSYAVGPTTGAGVIAGLAYTSVGSIGVPSEYVIGFDTNRIYELASVPLSPTSFRRGDVNQDGTLDISDPTAIIAGLFLGNDEALVACLDASDANDDGAVDLADPLTLLTFLFVGGVPVPPPSDCGDDPNPDPLDCLEYASC